MCKMREMRKMRKMRSEDVRFLLRIGGDQADHDFLIDSLELFMRGR